MSHAVQTTVLSLAGLRRLRFQTTCAGERIPEGARDEAESAARTALAALALAAIALAARGIMVVLESAIRRSDQGGYGSFSPSRPAERHRI